MKKITRQDIVCISCGARLQIDEEKSQAICEYCGSKYKIKDEHINAEAEQTNVENHNKVEVNKRGKTIMIMILILFIIFGVILSIIVPKTVNKKSPDDYPDDYNFSIENYSGRTASIFVKNMLKNVIDINEKNQRKVTIKYNDIETSDCDKLEKIIYDLSVNHEWDYYYISKQKDSKGYICYITITYDNNNLF